MSALFSRVHTWVTNEVLTASDLNAEFDNILTNAKASSVVGFSANATEMQTVTDPGGVGTESLAGAVSEELARLRFMLKFLSGQAQWYVQSGRSLSAGALAVQTADYVAGSINTAALGTNSVTAVKIVDATITGAKIASGINLSGSTVSVGSRNILVASANAVNACSYIRGAIDSSAATTVGEGFTASRLSTGKFQVSFTTSFSDTPAVVANANVPDGTPAICTVIGSGTGSFTVEVYDTGFALNNYGFSFVAIGRI